MSALDIFVESIAFWNDAPRADGRAGAGGGPGAALPRRAALVHAVGAGGAGARARAASTTSRRSTADDIAALASAPCAAVLLPAAEFLGAEHRAPARAILDAGRDRRARHRRQPGHRAGVLDAAGDRAGRSPVRPERRARRSAAATLNAAWTLDLRPRPRVDRARQARRPAACSTGRPTRSPTASATTRWRSRSSAGELVYVRDDAGAERIGAMSSDRGRTIPAMANAHSHAFQLDLRGSPSGSAPHPGDDFWSWRDRDVPAGRAATTRTSMRAVGDRVYAPDGRRRLRRRRRVSLRPPPARRHARTPTPTRWRSRSRRRRVAAGLEITLLPAAYHRGGWARSRLPPAPARCGSATRRRGVPGARRRAARLGGRPSGRHRRRRRAQRPRRPAPAGSRRSPPTATRTASSATSTPPSSGASWPSATPSTAARRSSCWTAAAFSARARASCTPSTSTTRDIDRLAAQRARSSSPARRPRATSATASCRGCATATPACGWRSAPTGRSASTRSRSCARWRRWPAARARPGSRCWPPPAATCGADVANGRASLGLTGEPAPIEIDLDHPELAGVAEADLGLRSPPARRPRSVGCGRCTPRAVARPPKTLPGADCASAGRADNGRHARLARHQAQRPSPPLPAGRPRLPRRRRRHRRAPGRLAEELGRVRARPIRTRRSPPGCSRRPPAPSRRPGSCCSSTLPAGAGAPPAARIAAARPAAGPGARRGCAPPARPASPATGATS